MNTGEGRTPACGRTVHPDCFQRKSKGNPGVEAKIRCPGNHYFHGMELAQKPPGRLRN